MYKVGRPIRPMFGHITRGGRATQFTVGQMHRKMTGEWVQDGLVQIIVKGEYHFSLGDYIIVNRVSGWKCSRSERGKDFFTIYADDIEYITKAEWELRQDPTLQQMSEDLPEELL